MCAFIALTAVLDAVSLSVPVGLAFAASVFALGAIPAGTAGDRQPTPPGWDLPTRAACAAAIVLGITGASSALGAHLAGLLAPFPIITSVLAGFTRAQAGAVETRRLLRGMVCGFFAFAAFCAIVAVGLPAVGTGPGFLIASLSALLVNAVALTIRPRTPTPAAASSET